MEKDKAIQYLTELLGKSLRITTTDTRMFLGQLRCLDADCNLILDKTHEYRLPSTLATISNEIEQESNHTLNLSSRYVGLVVIPGRYITRVELEEFVSQLSESRRAEAGISARQKDYNSPKGDSSKETCYPLDSSSHEASEERKETKVLMADE
ncbi:hypothetical protein Golomagni_04698 [Golovinomyces magnicellulatus]|nr:hypothetical protein Golomagni_04698 [Golovinomyces magnicellulatus]